LHDARCNLALLWWNFIFLVSVVGLFSLIALTKGFRQNLGTNFGQRYKKFGSCRFCDPKDHKNMWSTLVFVILRICDPKVITYFFSKAIYIKFSNKTIFCDPNKIFLILIYYHVTNFCEKSDFITLSYFNYNLKLK